MNSWNPSRQLALWIFVTLALPVFSLPAAAESSVDRLMVLSGLDKELRFDAEQAAQEFCNAFVGQFEAQSGLTLSDDFQRMVAGRFAQMDLYSAVKQEIADGLSARQIKSLLRWYETDLGRRVTALETEANSPDSMERILAQVNSLLSDPANRARGERVDELLSVTDSMLQSIEQMQLAMVAGILGASDLPESAREQALTQIREAVAGSRSDMQQLAWAVTSYTYRDLSDADFDRYLQFLGQRPARAFYELVLAASAAQAETEYEALGQSIGAYLKDWVSEQRKRQETAALSR